MLWMCRNGAQPADDPLLQQRRKQRFPVEKVTEALTVGGQEPMHECCAAARMADNEHGRDNTLRPQPREKHVVQQEAEGMKQRGQGCYEQQPQQQAPAPRPLFEPPDMTQQAQVIINVEIHGVPCPVSGIQYSSPFEPAGNCGFEEISAAVTCCYKRFLRSTHDAETTGLTFSVNGATL